MFHFKHNLVKNVMKKNAKFKQCGHCVEIFKLIQALVYVPPGFVTEVYNKYIVESNKTSNCKNMNTFCNYFENTYVGKRYKNGKIKPPTFSVDLWNMFHVTNNKCTNTNNSLEAFNANFNGAQKGPQTIYTVIKGFIREVEYTEIKHGEISFGKYKEEHSGRKQEKYSRDEDLRNVMAKYNNENVLDYLRSIVIIVDRLN